MFQSKATEGYWQESTRPLVSLIFISPMLAAYECGLLLLGPHSLRNGADVWLRRLLDLLGFSQYFLLPLLICLILLAWHHLRHDRWGWEWSSCGGMLLESLVLGFVLLMVAQTQANLFPSRAGPAAWLSNPTSDAFGRVIGYFGAGIYEELLFRLMLLPVVAFVLRRGGIPGIASWLAAVVVTSVLFSAAHYRIDIRFLGYRWTTQFGEAFQWYSFVFRILAGVFFSLLFVKRGFGVTAGTHACYDILAAFS